MCSFTRRGKKRSLNKSKAQRSGFGFEEENWLMLMEFSTEANAHDGNGMCICKFDEGQ